MEFIKQDNQENSIIEQNDKNIKLKNNSLKIPCFVSKNYHCEINIKNLDEINKISIFSLINKDNIDLLIIGTGKKTQFIPDKKKLSIMQIINIETMNTQSATSCFNLLLSDNRNIGVLLL